MDADGADGEGSQTELVRQDVWLQSMVPSLPRHAAFVCLIFNIVVPGLGTVTGGILSCCTGRPRLDFRPATYRCPVAAVVIFVGFMQFFFTAFFLVGWLWSIIWGFLMLNLSDPKFRVMPKPPPPKNQPAAFGAKPRIRVNKPSYNYGKSDLKLPPGRKNFRRLITKARHNKEQALGLAPPLRPTPEDNSGETSTPRSLLSKIPGIKCGGSGPSKMLANAGSKFKGLFGTRPCSSSQTNLMDTADHNHPKSLSVDSLSDHRTEPDSPSTLSNGKCDPVPSDVVGDGDKFKGIVSVTPATPTHSSTSSSFVIDDVNTTASVEDVAASEPSLSNSKTLAILELATKETPQIDVEPLAPMEGKEVQDVTEKLTCDLNVPEASTAPSSVTRQTLDATENETVKPAPSKLKASEVTADESTIVPMTENAKTAIAVGVESRVKSEWTLQNELRPKMKQSLTYHFDA